MMERAWLLRDFPLEVFAGIASILCGVTILADLFSPAAFLSFPPTHLTVPVGVFAIIAGTATMFTISVTRDLRATGACMLLLSGAALIFAILSLFGHGPVKSVGVSLLASFGVCGLWRARYLVRISTLVTEAWSQTMLGEDFDGR